MGILYVVATPIGNLNDLSPRALDILKTSDYILVEDTRQTIKMLNYFNFKNKMVSYHKFNEKEKTNSIIKDLISGKKIALVSDAGTPCISDPGYILINEARKKNIDVIGIPGCSAVITALSISGLDTSSFSFYGFVPTEKKQQKELFDEIKNSNVKTKVLYESPKRILKLLETIKKEIPNCIICVCCELTKMHEKSIYGTINDVYEKMKTDPNVNKGEYVVLISNEKEQKKESKISIEAMIIDKVIKENISIKEAVNMLNKENKDLSKKDIYNASLKLKDMK